MKPTDPIPSDLVFETARTIASDMKSLVDESCSAMEDFSDIAGSMLDALNDIKDNLEKHAVPMSKKKSKERRAIRKKIESLKHAMSVAKKIEETLLLTVDDLDQIMKPFGAGKSTDKFLEKIMEEEPTDKELKDIEKGIDIDDEEEGYGDDMPPEEFA